jgi:hypothetical protein
MLDPNIIEKAKMVQQGLQQFDSLHQPRLMENKEGKFTDELEGKFICGGCADFQAEVVDYPCHRMMMFMILQGLATLNASIPSGNMANVMQRFMKTGT